VNYEYNEDAYYKRIPLRPEHEKALKSLQNGDTKVIAAPHFPYDANTIIVEQETQAEDGGLSRVQAFVDSDPYVKKGLVSNYSIREFALKGATTDFDRLSARYVVRS
jgi:uncharacterized protein YciI